MKRYESQDDFKFRTSLAHLSTLKLPQMRPLGFAVKPLMDRRVTAFIAMPQAFKPVFTLRV